MKYMTFSKESDETMWLQIYCNLDGNETNEDIAKAIVSEFYVGKFNKNEHKSVCQMPIVNDKNVFVLRNSYGINNIWQIGGHAADMVGFIIPHLYKVRRIGVMFD